MATTHRSDLVDEIEKVLRDEAYDGGMGALGPEEFTDYVRGLAVTAAKVLEEAHTPTDDEREALEQAVLDGLNAHHAQSTMDPTLIEERVSDSVWAAGFRRSEVPEPSATGLRQMQYDDGSWSRTLEGEPVSGENDEARADVFEAHMSSNAQAVRELMQGEPSDAQVEHMRRALNAADIDYSAREQRADAGGGDLEPGDWFTFLARAALRAAGGAR
ncbi:hypothetical protein [Microbacterium sp.]|uniref:hypothetical protein n=1 Tax=Microbacterium sp. TaxID=51671 RepID=UPI0028994E56|nr:hypothetical protein [Microbacterium sp.]